MDATQNRRKNYDTKWRTLRRIMAEDRSLNGKVSVVTGAGGQIGEGIATELATAGSDVVIADVDVLDTEHNQQSSREVEGVARAEEVADRIEDHGQRAHIVECDVTKSEQVKEMVEETVEEFGGLDVLVNRAGLRPPASHGHGP